MKTVSSHSIYSLKLSKYACQPVSIDLLSSTKRVVIQCKKKEVKRRGVLKELKDDFDRDVQKVLKLDFKVSGLIFASTFQDSATLIEYLQRLKDQYMLDFGVSYVGWESLSAKAVEHPSILRKYF